MDYVNGLYLQGIISIKKLDHVDDVKYDFYRSKTRKNMARDSEKGYGGILYGIR